MLNKSIQNDQEFEEIITFEAYLSLITKEPWVTRNSTQLLHDMMLSRGVDHAMTTGKPVKHTYHFFEDSDIIGPYIVFGQQKAKENLVEKIHNASRGMEASKRLWILLGPPGSAKSRSMDGIKRALNQYSLSPAGKTYYQLLPTVDERLKEKALFEENGIFYLPSPLYEGPLQIIPQSIRKEFTTELTKNIDKRSINSWLKKHQHYDKNFKNSFGVIMDDVCAGLYVVAVLVLYMVFTS